MAFLKPFAMTGAALKFTRDSDPIEEALKPPANETKKDRAIRLAQESEARRVSQAIDDSIRAEKQTRAARQRTKPLRLLLLGQSESGKSTILRHFQRQYTPTAFHDGRTLWRSVVQLNILWSVRTILDILSDLRRPPIDSGGEDSNDDGSDFPHELELLQIRLSPLRHIEALLTATLVPRSNEVNLTSSGHKWGAQEVPLGTTSTCGPPVSLGDTGMLALDEAQEVLHSCSYDIMALWNDKFVREVLRRKNIRLEESSGFFLNDLNRITALNYTPSDDDVLRAYLKTVRFSEYRFKVKAVAVTEWMVVDVGGGSRSQRATWARFFNDVDAIIFLAPISCFDQFLAEDRSVNRLEDSVLLWQAICSNKLLKNVDIVLFLNKCDILDAKLSSGIRLSKYVLSYGDRLNDMETASKYFRSAFIAIHRECSPPPRKLYVFCTTVTDTTTAASILACVGDIRRRHIKQSRLL